MFQLAAFIYLFIWKITHTVLLDYSTEEANQNFIYLGTFSTGYCLLKQDYKVSYCYYLY